LKTVIGSFLATFKIGTFNLKIRITN